MKCAGNRALSLIVMLFTPMAANADIIYDWSGTCEAGCTTASGVLTLEDAFTESVDFLVIDFVITIDEIDFSLDFQDTPSLMPGSAPAGFGDLTNYAIFLDANFGSSLETFVSADLWQLSFGGTGADGEFLFINANGSDNSFVERISVPEPGTLALLALGLAGIGLTRRRRKA